MLNARNLASAIFEHQQFLRTKLKYDDSLSEDALAAFEACRAHLWDKLKEAQVSEYF